MIKQWLIMGYPDSVQACLVSPRQQQAQTQEELDELSSSPNGVSGRVFKGKSRELKGDQLWQSVNSDS
jgi:hypothetical protein